MIFCIETHSGPFVRINNKSLHAECFRCNTCGTSLKNVGYFNINDKLYCDVHAKQLKSMLNDRGAFNPSPTPAPAPIPTAANKMFVFFYLKNILILMNSYVFPNSNGFLNRAQQQPQSLSSVIPPPQSVPLPNPTYQPAQPAASPFAPTALNFNQPSSPRQFKPVAAPTFVSKTQN